MKKLFRAAFIGLALTLGATSPARAQGKLTNFELRKASIFAEAEDFAVPKGWNIVPGHGIDMYTPAVSGGKTVHNAVEGTATLDVIVPKDGAYTMWAWFTKWQYDRSFELRVEQNGTVVATSVYNRPADKDAPWSYNLQKGEAVAQLKAGPARLILYAGPFGGYVGSPVDCVLLTSVADYTKPDWHDFAPQAFVRFTMLTPGAPAVKASVYSRRHHEPWVSTSPDLASADGGPVPPGQPSAWSDISATLDVGAGVATAILTFTGDKPLPPLWRLKFDIAAKPDEKSIVKSFDEEWDGNVAAYILTGDITRYTEGIESVAMATKRHVALADSLKLPGGSGDFRPKYLTIAGSADSWSPRLHTAENGVLAKMGINSVLYPSFKRIIGQGVTMDPSKTAEMHFIHDGGLTGCSFDPALQAKLEQDLTAWVDGIKKNDPAEFRSLRLVILADEPGTPNGLTHIVAHQLDWEPFRAWLKARGATPQQFGFTDWAEVKPVMPAPKAEAPLRRLGWLSSLFAQETAPLPYQRATAILQKAFGRPIETRVNFTDEPLGGYRTTMSNGDGFNWFEFARARATTIPWTEDWMFGDPQLTPFLADLLHSTTAPTASPLGMYIIWGYGPPLSPHSAELRTMTAAGRGVKTFDHYWYGPHYASTECAFSEDETYVKSVAYVDRVLGLSDDVLGPAMPPARKVAILWSQSTEVWKPDDAFTMERRLLHFALSAQQVPVDFIDEKGILNRLNDYKVLFLPANNLTSACASAIASWVKAGGTLIVCGGGPDHDEDNEPAQPLLSVMGLQSVEMRKDAIGYRDERMLAAAGTAVTLAGKTAAIPVAGYKAILTPLADARVLGSYKEGGAAIVEHPDGKGKALTFGFNPGLSLLSAMDPAKLAKLPFWNVFPGDELRLISDPVFAAGVQPPVSTSQGVDAARLDGPDGSALTLANFTLEPIQKLRVTVRDVKARKIVSAVHGALKFQRVKGDIVVELPLDTVDVIKLYK